MTKVTGVSGFAAPLARLVCSNFVIDLLSPLYS